MSEPEGVLLIRSNPAAWSRYPKEIRTALLKGTERVKRIRSELSSSAKVRSMPLVRAFDEIWATPDRKRLVYGRTHTLRWNGLDYAVTDISAPVVVCDEDAAVRALLVHEFCHAFNLQARVIEGFDAGRAGEMRPRTDPFTDRAHEEGLRADPRDWFCRDDAEQFMDWEDERMRAFSRSLAGLSLGKHMLAKIQQAPYEVPDNHRIPDDVVAHIRYLRDRGAQSRP